jgi:uncharacterized cupredoxin-like copper-binding protein
VRRPINTLTRDTARVVSLRFVHTVQKESTVQKGVFFIVMAKSENTRSDFVGGKKFGGWRASASVRPRSMVALMILVFSAIATFVIAACGGQSSAPGGSTPTSTAQAIPAITIKAVDYSFQQPKSIPAGLVDITLTNDGKMNHSLQIFRLNDGVSYNQFFTALKNNDPKFVGMVKAYGGANSILPGQSQEVILNLQQPGQYVSLCFDSDADNVPHFMKGMITQFTVTASPANQAQPPKDNGEIVLRDFSFQLPASIPSGPVTLKVTNQGPQIHEADIVRLTQGKTLQDLKNFLNQPNATSAPSFVEPTGGLGAIQPGTSVWLKLNLKPGNYAVLCFVPDAKTGKPHFMLGMLDSFTVQ